MAVGMLVDGAIVVSEFADRAMSEGKPRKAAYKLAEVHGVANHRFYGNDISGLCTIDILAGNDGRVYEILADYAYCHLVCVITYGIGVCANYWWINRKVTPLRTAKTGFRVSRGGDLTQIKGMLGRYIRVLDYATERPWWSLAAAIVFSILVFFAFAVSKLGLSSFRC